MRMVFPSIWVLVAALAMLGCARRPAPPNLGPPEVTVSVPIARTVTDYEDFIGRIDAIDLVEIKSRVTGYLTKVLFKDGDLVKEGDPLYEIDPRPYAADLDKARGLVEKLVGEKKLLETQVARYTRLVAQEAASKQELDIYLGQQAENKGALVAAESAVRYAELYLTFCTIKAPVSGQLSRTSIQVGNLVTADQTMLTTLVTLDPVYVYFSIEEATYLRLPTRTSQGVYQDPTNVEVQVGLADDVEGRFPYRARVDFVNNTVNPQTGTVLMRGVLANGDRRFKPGLFARVRAPIGKPHSVLLVADQALNADQGQKFLYVLDEQNRVRYQRVRAGLLFDGLRAIEEGLEPGARVVVNGLQRVRPGIEVKAQTVDMNHWQAGPDAKKQAGEP